MQILVDDLLTSYDVQGDGQPVLFLHGWGDNHQSFKQLTAHLPGLQAVLLDLPGFGKTQAPKEVWGLSEYAQFVADFLAKIDCQTTAIAGHSNGGAIAIRGLAQGILKADKLILLASAGIRDEYKGRKKALRVLAKGAKVLVSPLPKRLQRKLKVRAYQTIGSDLFVAEHLQETFKKVVTDDVLADAAKVKVPTLLVYGTADNATPPRYGEKLAQALPKADLKVIAEVGHFVQTEAPEIVADYIEEFLK